MLTGVGLTSAGLLAAMLASGLWSHDDGADPAASTSATGNDTAPSAGTRTPGPAQLPTAPAVTRLRNDAADLCLDIRGTVKEGSRHRTGGLLDRCDPAVVVRDRRVAAQRGEPGAVPGLARGRGCGHPRQVRRRPGEAGRGRALRPHRAGELIPRWDEQLALAATTDDPGADIVVKVRDRSEQQRWLTDPAANASPGSLSVTGSEAPQARPAELRDRA